MSTYLFFTNKGYLFLYFLYLYFLIYLLFTISNIYFLLGFKLGKLTFFFPLSFFLFSFLEGLCVCIVCVHTCRYIYIYICIHNTRIYTHTYINSASSPYNGIMPRKTHHKFKRLSQKGIEFT